MQLTDGVDGDGMVMKLISAPPHKYEIDSPDVIYLVQKLNQGL